MMVGTKFIRSCFKTSWVSSKLNVVRCLSLSSDKGSRGASQILIILSFHRQVHAQWVPQILPLENAMQVSAHQVVLPVTRQTTVTGVFFAFSFIPTFYLYNRKYHETECSMLSPAIELQPNVPNLEFCLAICTGNLVGDMMPTWWIQQYDLCWHPGCYICHLEPSWSRLRVRCVLLSKQDMTILRWQLKLQMQQNWLRKGIKTYKYFQLYNLRNQFDPFSFPP